MRIGLFCARRLGYEHKFVSIAHAIKAESLQLLSSAFPGCEHDHKEEEETEDDNDRAKKTRII